MSNENELANEWAAKNFKGILNTLDNQQEELQELKQKMIDLQKHITMQNQEIMTLKNRINVLQSGQVLGALN